jgi:chitinase
MPFDGGFSGGSSQVTALQDFNAQLQSTFGWSASQAYAHEGFSGMNGRTDTGEYFYQSDFQTVLNFAESSGMSRYTFWSVNRDRECSPVDNNDVTSSECSSVAQNSWDFTAYTVAFADNTTSTGGGGGGGSSGGGGGSGSGGGGTGTCTAAWVSNNAYISGDEASYNGDNWTANQWNYDEVPGGASGAWNNDGAC